MGKLYTPVRAGAVDEFGKALSSYWHGGSSIAELQKIWNDAGGSIQFYLMQKYPFQGESCSACSHHLWGSYDDSGIDLVPDSDDGEVSCCDVDGLHEAPEDWIGDLSVRDALEYLKDICPDRDIPPPFTEKDVSTYIKRRKKLTKKLGFAPGEFLVENIRRSPLLDFKKINPNNRVHSSMMRGNVKIPLNLYDLDAINRRVLKGSAKAYKIAAELSNVLMDLWTSNKQNALAKSKLSPAMAMELTSKRLWTFGDYDLGQSVLKYLVTDEEWKAVNDSGKWYGDLHTFVAEDRKGLVKDLVGCLQGVSYSMSEL